MKKITTAIAITLAIFISSGAAASTKDDHNFFGIFLGYTNADSETDFSYGIEYEYKFNDMWGAGLVYEKTDDAHHGDGIDVKLAAVYLHPWQELRLGLGLGKEKVGGAHPHSENVTRLSASYDFHLGGIGIAPTLAFDFVDGEHATVFGVAFLKSF